MTDNTGTTAHARTREPRSGQRDVLWSIEYLRALSAFGVIVFHTLSDTGDDFEFGAVGIHLFFVISGYLMWATTANSRQSAGHFLSSRTKRIMPLYWIATFATLYLSTRFEGFFYQATLLPAHVVKSLLFIPQIGVDGGMFPVLYQGWTLQFEMFFYVVFAFSLIFGLASRLWVVTAIIGALSMIGMMHPRSPNPLLATYTDPICMEFLAGAWAAKLCARGLPSARIGWLLVLAGLPGLWLADRYADHFGPLEWVAIASAASAIIVGAVILERQGRVPRLSWLKYAGEASYSMYLFQEFGFLGASRLTETWPILPRALAYCIGAVIVGLLVFRFVEKPLQRRLKQGSSISPRGARRVIVR